MSRLAVTFSDSAAGCLQSARRADCVIAFEERFVWGRLPSSIQLDALLAPHSAQTVASAPHWFDHLRGARVEDARRDGLGFAAFCANFDDVDLWVDLDPNGQLQFIWLLDFLRRELRAAPALNLVQTDGPISDLQPIELDISPVQIDDEHVATASAAWAAWRAPTPESWFDLLNRDLRSLSQLRETIVALLEELPGHRTGLGATPMRLLELIAAGHAHPYDLFPGVEKPNQRRTFSYWKIGTLLDSLARCPAPLVTGLDEGPFDLAMHEDSDRHQRYKRSRLSLTELGRAIMAGDEDFSRHNPIHHWWGGNELTNDRLWRWDAEKSSLIAPEA